MNDLKVPQERLLSIGRSESLRCIICHEISLFPSECTQCQNLFCMECIRNWQTIKNVCPLQCKGPFKLKDIHPILKETIRNLQYSCKNTDSGCQFTGPIVHLLIHEAEKCEFSRIRCRYQGCEETFLKKTREKHELNCKYKESICQFCQYTMKRSQMEDHDCFKDLNATVVRLMKTAELTATRIFVLTEKLENLKKTRQNDSEEEISNIIEKNLKTHTKNLRSAIRKQIEKETHSNLHKLSLIDLENAKIPIDIDSGYRKGACCEKPANLIWNAKIVRELCGDCGVKNRLIRFKCNVCMIGFCGKCRKEIAVNGKCPLAHKFMKEAYWKNEKGKEEMECCELCGGHFASNETRLIDKFCLISLCETCFRPFKAKKKT